MKMGMSAQHRSLSQPHPLADAATLRRKLAKASLRGEGQDEGVFLLRREKVPPHPSPLPEGRGDARSALMGQRQR